MSVYDQCLVEDLDMAEAALKAGHEAQVQFGETLRDDVLVMKFNAQGELIDGPLTPSAPYLERVDAMCARWGDQLNVRFYGHYKDGFDASILARLPNIRSLTVNSLHEVHNPEAIAQVTGLTRLHIGIYELKDRDFLAKLPLAQLTEFTLEETETKALDLAPLARGTRLKLLRIFGHKKNIAALAALTDLEEFAFNPNKATDLSFLNAMTGLRALKFVLGGTDAVGDVSLPHLEDLAFTMVRGLTDIGDLARFPALRRFFVQDQKQLTGLRIARDLPDLRHMWIYNCPVLADIPGLRHATHLTSLRAVKTAIALKALDLPKTLTHLYLFSTKAKEEAAERAAIEALGLIPEDHPDMPFFYK